MLKRLFGREGAGAGESASASRHEPRGRPEAHGGTADAHTPAHGDCPVQAQARLFGEQEHMLKNAVSPQAFTPSPSRPSVRHASAGGVGVMEWSVTTVSLEMSCALALAMWCL